MKNQPKKDTIFNLHSFYQHFPDEKTCREYLKKQRFPDGKVVCPKCGTFDKIYELKDGKRYKCGQKGCKHIFTITVGTIFEASHISLHKWFLALYVISAHKKGISSLQLHRDIGVTQKTAWFMLHRIRHMFVLRSYKQILSGEIEVDELYYGGKEKFMHAKKKNQPKLLGKYASKVPVFGLVQRGGNLITTPAQYADRATALDLISEKVKFGSTVISDQNNIYHHLKHTYKHKIINHQKGYVKGDIHTNTIEGYWSLLRRGILGIYHYVSPKHLHRYCDEFQYRYNTRKINDAERFKGILEKSEVRLKYSTLINTKSILVR